MPQNLSSKIRRRKKRGEVMKLIQEKENKFSPNSNFQTQWCCMKLSFLGYNVKISTHFKKVKHKKAN